MSVSVISLRAPNVVRLALSVEDADWHDTNGNLIYTHIVIHKSVLTKSGPFVPATNDAWLPASTPDGGSTVPSPDPGPLVVLDGKELLLEIDKTFPVTVQFSGTDPMSFGEAATQIDVALGGFGYCFLSTSHKIVIQTSRMGSTASLSIEGGDAAPLLDLPSPSLFIGKDPHIPLVKRRTNYSFQDLYGSDEYWYDVRLFNKFTRGMSDSFGLVQAGDVRQVDQKDIAVGKIKLINHAGYPVHNALVTIQVLDSGIKKDQIVSSRTIDARTGRTGEVLFHLLRGYKIRVSVPELGMNKELVVPDREVFDLLDPAFGTDDLFVPRRTDTVYARRVDNKRNRQ